MSSSLAPTNGINVRRFKIHKLELLLPIKKELQHSPHDVRYGGNADDLRLFQINHFKFHARFEFMGLHFLDEMLQIKLINAAVFSLLIDI